MKRLIKKKDNHTHIFNSIAFRNGASLSLRQLRLDDELDALVAVDALVVFFILPNGCCFLLLYLALMYFLCWIVRCFALLQETFSEKAIEERFGYR
jgi:hypothetical protein